jgi:hypothetical protein
MGKEEKGNMFKIKSVVAGLTFLENFMEDLPLLID